MTHRIVIRPETAFDLIEAECWYEQQQPGLGDTFARRAADIIDEVGEFPHRYGTIWKNVRAVTVPRHSYVVYYRVFDDYVEILAVVHARRNSSVWKNRAR